MVPQYGTARVDIFFFYGWDDIHEKSFSHEKGEVDLSLKKWHVLC